MEAGKPDPSHPPLTNPWVWAGVALALLLGLLRYIGLF